MQATICIPARLQSTRLANKLLIPIEGKSLLQHTYENLQQLDCDIFILVDDEKLFIEAQRFGAQVLLTPKECLNGLDRISWATQNKPENFVHDLIVNVQGDEPLVDIDCLKRMIQQHLQNPKADTYTMYSKIDFEKAKEPANVKVVIDSEDRALYFSRSLIPYHEKPHAISYFHHHGVYSYQKTFLNTLSKIDSTPYQQHENLEQLKILEKGYTIYAIESQKPSIGIDTEKDLEDFKKWVCKQKFYSSQEASFPH